MPHDVVRRFFEALVSFLGRYWIFLTIAILGPVMKIRQIRAWMRRAHEIGDPTLTPEWSDHSTSLTGTARGSWLGRRASLRRAPSSRSADAVEIALTTMTTGRFLIERAQGNLLIRQIHLGAPPVVEAIDPENARLFGIRSTDRTLTDRLLADARARDALLAALQDVSDSVSLGRGRYTVRRRIDRRTPPGPPIAEALAALKEIVRVLG